jgi:DNA-binding protein HU-beta
VGATYDHLKEMLLDSAVGLADVVPKKMFGCDALFRGGGGGGKDQIFALVWKQDRLGVRLPAEAAFHDAMKLDGAAPWAPMGTKGMAHWVLLPEEMHDVPEDVAAWVARAHALAVGGAPAKKKPAAKKPAAKTIGTRSTAKKAVAKKPAKKAVAKKPAKKAAVTKRAAKPAKKRTKR